MYTLITPKARELAFSCAACSYHRELLEGVRSWTGTDLQGLQAYGSNRKGAAFDREHLLYLIIGAGLWWERTRGWRGRIVMVIMTTRERRLGWDNYPEYIALNAIEKAERAAAERKAKRARVRAERKAEQERTKQ